MDYKNKYLKYKKKYLDLKNMSGGVFTKYEADKQNYIMDKNNKGKFEGDVFIDEKKYENIKYDGTWNYNKNFDHYYGNFKSNSGSQKNFDCAGMFENKDSKKIFSGICSDKLIIKNYTDKSSIDNARNINELEGIDYLKKTLFYQNGWEYIQDVSENTLINMYCNNLKYDINNINIIRIISKEVNENSNYFYCETNIENNVDFFKKKTVVILLKNNIYYLLLHNDDIVKYNLLIDIYPEYTQSQVDKLFEIKKLFGIVNIKNSCYMNSCLQFFIHCPPFLKYIYENIKMNQLYDFYNIPNNNDFIKKLFFMFTKNDHAAFKEYKTLEYIRNNTDEMFANTEQYDVLEFMGLFMDKLEKNNILFKNMEKNLGNGFNIYPSEFINNPIQNIFYYFINDKITCFNDTDDKNLIYINSGINTESILKLPINTSKDFNDIINNYFEIIIDDVTNTSCKESGKRNSSKQKKLLYIPEIIIISLSRYIYDNDYIKYDENNKEHIKEEKLYFDSENGFIDILRKELPTEIDLSKIYIRKYISSKITEDIENIPSEINFEQYLDEKNYMNGINKNYKLKYKQ